jgi:hypothetical protein
LPSTLDGAKSHDELKARLDELTGGGGHAASRTAVPKTAFVTPLYAAAKDGKASGSDSISKDVGLALSLVSVYVSSEKRGTRSEDTVKSDAVASSNSEGEGSKREQNRKTSIYQGKRRTIP